MESITNIISRIEKRLAQLKRVVFRKTDVEFPVSTDAKEAMPIEDRGEVEKKDDEGVGSGNNTPIG